jgi:hypothetical protein
MRWPGQDPGLLERLDRFAHRVAVAFGNRGDALERREAPTTAIGPVEAPQDRLEDVHGGTGERPPVLAGLTIGGVVGRRCSPHAGLGIAVQWMRRSRSDCGRKNGPPGVPTTRECLGRAPRLGP